MKFTKKHFVAALLLGVPTAALAADGIGPFTNSALVANQAVGSPANVLSSDFTATVVVAGSNPIENPSGVITKFGMLSTGVLTEPDQNTYAVISSTVKGPTAKYDYGHHFLFQAHENSSNLAYISRINLDVADPAHRVTLLTPVGGDQLTHFSRIDGITYNPRTKSLFATQEGGGTDGGVIEVSSNWPATVTTHYGSIGHCGVEGIHVDKAGRFYLVEDTGGTSASNDNKNVNGSVKVAKQPNSYIYRFVPYDVTNISAGGKLQALQVSVGGQPLIFGGTTPDAVFNDVWSENQKKLHSGNSLPAKWITIHDTATSTAEFDCNATARAAGATPFKRPENGAFKPDGKFNTYYFATTGGHQ